MPRRRRGKGGLSPRRSGQAAPAPRRHCRPRRRRPRRPRTRDLRVTPEGDCATRLPPAWVAEDGSRARRQRDARLVPWLAWTRRSKRTACRRGLAGQWPSTSCRSRCAAGRVTGFVGPNGAGKSTTMRIVLALDAPDRGEVLVGGRRYDRLDRPLHEVGALLDAAATHPGRSARSHLRWLARSNGISRARVDEVLELVGLAEVAHRRTGGYSLGMAQRLGIAAALLGDPQVLLLDEPINGLDPEGIRLDPRAARELADEGRTVFVSSHLMSELEGTADDLVVIGRGRLIAETSVSRAARAAVRRRGSPCERPTPRGLMTVLARAGATCDLERRTDSARRHRPRRGAESPTLAAEHGCALEELAPHRTRSRTPSSSSRARQSSTGRRERRRHGTALRAEWIKLRTVRSTAWSLLLFAGVSVLFSASSPRGPRRWAAARAGRGTTTSCSRASPASGSGRSRRAVLAVLADHLRVRHRDDPDEPRGRPAPAHSAGAKAAVVGHGRARRRARHERGVLPHRPAALPRRRLHVRERLSGHHAHRRRGVPRGRRQRRPTSALLAVFALGVGAILRHTAGAITRRARGHPRPRHRDRLPARARRRVLEKGSLMSAGLALQQTVDRPDNIPLAPGADWPSSPPTRSARSSSRSG